MGIFIDTRGSDERKLSELLKNYNIHAELKPIQSGDILIINSLTTIAIERKSIQDLLNSTRMSGESWSKSKGHFWSQLKVMKDTYQKNLVIIENKPSENPKFPSIFDFANREHAGIYFSIVCGWGIPVYLSENLDNTASFISKLFLKYGDSYVPKSMPVAVRKSKNTKDIKLAMFQCIDGIGPVLAKKLYDLEPLLFSSVLGPEYVEQRLSEIPELNGTPKKERIKNRLLDVIYNRE